MRKLIGTLSLVVIFGCVAIQSRAETCNGFSHNLVSNCSFETGDFAGWSSTASLSGDAGVDTFAPYAGTYEAYLGASSPIALTQTLVTTVGSVYEIEFALLNDTSVSPGYTNSFSLLFGGTTLFSESAVPAGGYKFYSFVGSATSSSTVLSFVSQNDGGFFDLDSISVSGVTPVATTPEPSTFVLLGTGVLGVAGVLKRRFA